LPFARAISPQLKAYHSADSGNKSAYLKNRAKAYHAGNFRPQAASCARSQVTSQLLGLDKFFFLTSGPAPQLSSSMPELNRIARARFEWFPSSPIIFDRCERLNAATFVRMGTASEKEFF